jgi:ferrous iron transport protein B
MFHTWNRLKSFIVRAGRVIILVVVILSFVSSIGLDGRFRQPGSRDSVLSAVSRKITPVFQPMGLTRDNWPATVSLCMGIFSKELIIGALDSLYTHVDVAADAQRYPAWDKGHFRRGLRRAFMTIPNGFRRFYESLQDPLGLKQSAENGSGPGIAREMDVQQKTLSAMSRYFDGMRGAFAYLLFVLIYAPCVATIAAVYRETNWRWALFMVLYLTGLAWTMATLFYQVSTWVVHPFSSSLWIALCLGVLGLFYLGMYLRGRLAAVRMPGGPS